MRPAFCVSVAASLVLAAAVLSIALAGAAAAEENVSVEVETEKTHFIIGEPVNVTVVVRNLGTVAVTLTFQTSLQAYYLVEDSEGTELFNLKYEVDVLNWLTYLELGPGESKAYVFDETNSWKQVDSEGNPVPIPGEYVIRGMLDCVNSYAAGSAVITLGYAGATPEFPGVAIIVCLVAVMCILAVRRSRSRT